MSSCWVSHFLIIMLNVTVLNVIMLNVIMPCVIVYNSAHLMGNCNLLPSSTKHSSFVQLGLNEADTTESNSILIIKTQNTELIQAGLA
jgi:hypothetical protein